MMRCVLCGKEAKLVKAEVEGAIVEVCEGCAKFGSVVAQPRYDAVKREVKLDFKEEDVVPGYGKVVESARLKKGLSREELAKALLEKESTIRRVEKEKMVPDEELVKKLEKFLGVKLLEEYVEKKRKTEKRKGAELTLGDVVEVK